MQVFSSCVTWPCPFCWKINRFTSFIHQHEVWTQREHLSSHLTFIEDKALHQSHPLTSISFLESQSLSSNKGEVNWKWDRKPESQHAQNQSTFPEDWCPSWFAFLFLFIWTPNSHCAANAGNKSLSLLDNFRTNIFLVMVSPHQAFLNLSLHSNLHGFFFSGASYFLFNGP